MCNNIRFFYRINIFFLSFIVWIFSSCVQEQEAVSLSTSPTSTSTLSEPVSIENRERLVFYYGTASDLFLMDGVQIIDDPNQPYLAVATSIPFQLRQAMVGNSWQEGCPVPIDDLAYMRLLYKDYDNQIRVGEMVMHKKFVGDLANISFRELYKRDFLIERMRLPDHYSYEDIVKNNRLDENNITSGFFCRNSVTSDVFSQHAYGLAMDLNPATNPYVKADFKTAMEEHTGGGPNIIDNYLFFLGRALGMPAPKIMLPLGSTLQAPHLADLRERIDRAAPHFVLDTKEQYMEYYNFIPRNGAQNLARNKEAKGLINFGDAALENGFLYPGSLWDWGGNWPNWYFTQVNDFSDLTRMVIDYMHIEIEGAIFKDYQEQYSRLK